MLPIYICATGGKKGKEALWNEKQYVGGLLGKEKGKDRKTMTPVPKRQSLIPRCYSHRIPRTGAEREDQSKGTSRPRGIWRVFAPTKICPGTCEQRLKREENEPTTPVYSEKRGKRAGGGGGGGGVI